MTTDAPPPLPIFLKEHLRIFYEYGHEPLPCPECGGTLDEIEHPEATEYACRYCTQRFVVLSNWDEVRHNGDSPA